MSSSSPADPTQLQQTTIALLETLNPAAIPNVPFATLGNLLPKIALCIRPFTANPEVSIPTIVETMAVSMQKLSSLHLESVRTRLNILNNAKTSLQLSVDAAGACAREAADLELRIGQFPADYIILSAWVLCSEHSLVRQLEGLVADAGFSLRPASIRDRIRSIVTEILLSSSSSSASSVSSWFADYAQPTPAAETVSLSVVLSSLIRPPQTDVFVVDPTGGLLVTEWASLLPRSIPSFSTTSSTSTSDIEVVELCETLSPHVKRLLFMASITHSTRCSSFAPLLPSVARWWSSFYDSTIDSSSPDEEEDVIGVRTLILRRIVRTLRPQFQTSCDALACEVASLKWSTMQSSRELAVRAGGGGDSSTSSSASALIKELEEKAHRFAEDIRVKEERLNALINGQQHRLVIMAQLVKAIFGLLNRSAISPTRNANHPRLAPCVEDCCSTLRRDVRGLSNLSPWMKKELHVASIPLGLPLRALSSTTQHNNTGPPSLNEDIRALSRCLLANLFSAAEGSSSEELNAFVTYAFLASRGGGGGEESTTTSPSVTSFIFSCALTAWRSRSNHPSHPPSSSELVAHFEHQVALLKSTRYLLQDEQNKEAVVTAAMDSTARHCDVSSLDDRIESAVRASECCEKMSSGKAVNDVFAFTAQCIHYLVPTARPDHGGAQEDEQQQTSLVDADFISRTVNELTILLRETQSDVEDYQKHTLPKVSDAVMRGIQQYRDQRVIPFCINAHANLDASNEDATVALELANEVKQLKQEFDGVIFSKIRRLSSASGRGSSIWIPIDLIGRITVALDDVYRRVCPTGGGEKVGEESDVAANELEEPLQDLL